jgi:hypothetical protein
MKPEELKNIAPRLSELKKLDSGFKVPKKYFGVLEDAVFLKVFIETLENEVPYKIPKGYFESIEDRTLDTIKSNKKEDNFSIPDNYFETIEDRVFEKINKSGKVIPLKSRFVKTFIPIAAAASLLIFITLQLFTDTNSNDLLASLEESEIENWIESGDLELSSYEIAEIYEDVNFEELELNQLYNDENLIEYLDDIDIESLNLTN